MIADFKIINEISKNKVLFNVLEALGKFAVDQRHIIRNWFWQHDVNREGTVPSEDLQKIISGQKAATSAEERKHLIERYKKVSSSYNAINPPFDYQTFEKEIALVYPLYSELAGITLGSTKRNPDEVLLLYLREVNKQFKNLSDFIREIDRDKKKYLNRGDLQTAMKRYEPHLVVSPEEFNSIYLMVNPRKEAKILYNKLEEMLNSYVLPLIKEVRLF